MMVVVMNWRVGLRMTAGGRDDPTRDIIDDILQEQIPAAQDRVAKMKKHQCEKLILSITNIATTTYQVTMIQRPILKSGRPLQSISGIAGQAPMTQYPTLMISSIATGEVDTQGNHLTIVKRSLAGEGTQRSLITDMGLITIATITAVTMSDIEVQLRQMGRITMQGSKMQKYLKEAMIVEAAVFT